MKTSIFKLLILTVVFLLTSCSKDDPTPAPIPSSLIYNTGFAMTIIKPDGSHYFTNDLVESDNVKFLKKTTGDFEDANFYHRFELDPAGNVYFAIDCVDSAEPDQYATVIVKWNETDQDTLNYQYLRGSFGQSLNYLKINGKRPSEFTENGVIIIRKD